MAKFDDILEKTPNWLRWALIPVVALITLIAVWGLANLLNKIFSFLGPSDYGSEKFFSYVVIPGLASYYSVLASAYIAPNYKYTVTILISFIWIFVAGGLTFFTFLSQEWSTLLAIGSFIVGVAASSEEARKYE